MKKVLIGLLVLLSISTFAQEVSIGGYGNDKYIVTISGDKGIELYDILDVTPDEEGTKRAKDITCWKSGICVFDLTSKGKIKHTNH